jgi:SAM-dependent methyltransferase
VVVSNGKNAQSCRLCGVKGQLSDLGALPNSFYFAGAKTTEVLLGGRLQSCGHCGSSQRSEIYSEDFYNELYRSGKADAWSDQTGRKDNDKITNFIAGHSQIETVLDVGCGVGDLLNALPAHITKFGIEPSQEAKISAQTRNIKVLGDTIASLKDPHQFDCITAVDVIEHIVEPNAFIKNLYQHLRPSGVLIISTGDPEATAWRNFLKASFWYSSFPEHLSFPSQKHYAALALQLGADKVDFENFRYFDGRLIKKLAQAFLQFSYALSPALHRMLLKFLFRMIMGLRGGFERDFFLPCAGLFHDHHICFLYKPSNI